MVHDMTMRKIALAGNPNSGKTTLFNALTGRHQKVGNWPGVTVERKSGHMERNGEQVEIVDLPGTYGLDSPAGEGALDEKVARDFLQSGEVDLIVNLLDASNLERGLYLTLQLLEMQLPVILVLNKTDLLADEGLSLNQQRLAELTDLPVLEISARRRTGIGILKDHLCSDIPVGTSQNNLCYGEPLARVATEIRQMQGGSLWSALAALASDPHGSISSLRNELEGQAGLPVDLVIEEARFSTCQNWAGQVLQQVQEPARNWSDRIDALILHRFAGPVIFLACMYLMFMFTINFGGAFIDAFDMVAGAIFVEGFGRLLTAAGLPDWVRVIFADGFGGGIQVVATFIPIIGCLYLFLALLEDSGYMARAAFLMDRLMRHVGLPGKAFVPLIVGFGCNVPSISASRSLDRQKDRIMTVMMAPFMSCGARLAVYVLFAAAFFPVGGQNMVFALYLIGIIAAVATGIFLKHTLLQGQAAPFMIELPPYNLPRPGDVMISAWVRLKGFLLGAGKVIVLVVAVLSILNSVGPGRLLRP